MRGPESDSRNPGIRLTDTGVFVFVSSHIPHTHIHTTMNSKICLTAIKQPDRLCSFMEANNLELDSRDKTTYETPLGYAVKEDDYPAVKVLLELGANPNVWGYFVDDTAKYTPLHLAKSGEVTKLLLEYGADVSALDSNFADSISSTLAHLIHLNCQDNSYWDKLEVLLDWIVNNDSVTLLTYAEVFIDDYPSYIKNLIIKDIEKTPENIHELVDHFVTLKQDEYHGIDYEIQSENI